MVNLTKDKFERLLDKTDGVENYAATFVVNGNTYRKKDFEILVKRKSKGSIFNFLYSRVRLNVADEVILYDRPKLEKILKSI